MGVDVRGLRRRVQCDGDPRVSQRVRGDASRVRYHHLVRSEPDVHDFPLNGGDPRVQLRAQDDDLPYEHHRDGNRGASDFFGTLLNFIILLNQLKQYFHLKLIAMT